MVQMDQIDDDKIDNLGSFGNRPIFVHQLFDDILGVFSLIHTFIDLPLFLFRRVQSVDQFVVILR